MTAFGAWRPHQCVGRWWQSRLIDEGLAMGVDSTLDSSSGTLSALGRGNGKLSCTSLLAILRVEVSRISALGSSAWAPTRLKSARLCIELKKL